MYKLLHRHYHKKYHLKYRHAKKLFFIDIALLIFALALLGISTFIFLWTPGMMDKVDLSIKLNTERIKSGDDVCFNIHYHNRNTVKLENPILGIHLPIGFIVDTQKTHKNYSDQSTILLPDIEPSGQDNISVCGQIWVKPETEIIITAALTYQPEETDYNEQKNSSFLLRLPESVLNTKLITPEQSLVSTNIPITYSIQNNSKKIIKNIFLYNNLNIEMKNAEDGFNLKPGEIKNIPMQTSANSSLQNLNIEFTSQVLINNTYIKQTNDTQTVKMIKPVISINAKYDTENKFVKSNQTLPITIKWQNKNDYTLSNMEIELVFEPNIINLEKTAKTNNIKIRNGKLVIDGEKRTALSSALKNIEDSFTIDLKTIGNISLQGLENPYLIIKPTLVVKLDDLNGQSYVENGESAKLPIATKMSWEMESRYYTPEGDQLGRGPLPPQVGETTKYWILTKIWNTTNAVKNAKFTATLPIGVKFTKKQSVTIGPSLSFNESTRQINWSYSKLPPNSQTGLYFEVSVTPNESQSGNTIELLKNANLTATDTFTQKEITLMQDSINNGLQADDKGIEKGHKVKE